MKRLDRKNGWFSSAIVLGITVSTSILTACSTNSPQAQAPNSATTASSQPNHSAMNHSKMDHSTMHNMGMDLGPADADYDLRFIDAMIPHHRGAIEMANEALQKSQRPEIKSLAQNIIKAQNREEKELMRKWRAAWYPKTSETPMSYNSKQGKMVPMSAAERDNMMMKTDLGGADAEFDLRFINAMVPHHEGAVTMAQDALQKTQRPEVKQLANEIIVSQKAEIDQMKQWRKTWYGK